MDSELHNFSRLLLVLFTNDNHISNVKSLQSIFKLEYPQIELVIVNDDTDAFQSERFFYNITDHTPDNVLKVQLVENPYPRGEIASLKDILKKIDAEYVFILHAGEQFSAPRVLQDAVLTLEETPDAAVVVSGFEKKSDDLKRVIRKYVFLGMNTQSDDEETETEGYTDAMFLYRAALLREAVENAGGQGKIHEAAVSFFENIGADFVRSSQTICFATVSSLTVPKTTIPLELGNVRLREIARMTAAGGTKEAPVKRSESATISPANKRTLWLYKNSRFVRVKTDILITLIYVLLAAFFLMEKRSLILGYLFAAAALFVGLWVIAMLCCNLYFRKYPERLEF